MKRIALSFIAFFLLWGCEKSEIQQKEIDSAPIIVERNPVLDIQNEETDTVLKVAFLIPGPSPFWDETTNFMQEAANDLKVELQVFSAESNQYKMHQQLEKIVSGPEKIDAAVFQNFKKMAPNLISLAERNKINTFLFNSPISPEDEVGKPREVYKYWLGEMLPDDTGTSEKLTNILIEEAQNKELIGQDGKVHLIGIAGRIADTS